MPESTHIKTPKTAEVETAAVKAENVGSADIDAAAMRASSDLPGIGGCPRGTVRSGLCFRTFDSFASRITRWSGSPTAFLLAVLSVVAWAITGPIFEFSETWQLVINTGTTILTFLMVFVIQQSQNKDSIAVHLKLNELLASHQRASNRMLCIEDLDENELQQLLHFYRDLSEKPGTDPNPENYPNAATRSSSEGKQTQAASNRMVGSSISTVEKPQP